MKSRGVLPVVIDGAEKFNVSDVDVFSVELEGAIPLDEGTSLSGDVLKLKFATQDIVKNLGNVANRETRTLTLTGYLADGTPFEASDSVMMLCGGSKGPSKAPGAQGVFCKITPNPFNPTTQITYTLSTHGHIRMAIYDVAGRRVVTLVNETQLAGEHVVEWNASGRTSGMYFCRLETLSGIETRKLILLK